MKEEKYHDGPPLAHPIFCQCKAAPHGEHIAAFQEDIWQ